MFSTIWRKPLYFPTNPCFSVAITATVNGYTMNVRRRNYGQFGCPKYNQAAKIIARFGGEANLARILGINRVSVYRWQYRRPYGGDGLIPSPMAEKIRDIARREGVLLMPNDWMAEINVYDEETLAQIGTAPRRPQPAVLTQEAVTELLD